jgi:hypothetical protein
VPLLPEDARRRAGELARGVANEGPRHRRDRRGVARERESLPIPRSSGRTVGRGRRDSTTFLAASARSTRTLSKRRCGSRSSTGGR